MSILSALLASAVPANMPWLPLADAIVKASLLLALAALATSVLRKAAASVRHLIWTLALVSALVVPALSSTLPRWELPLVTIAGSDQLLPAPAPPSPLRRSSMPTGEAAAALTPASSLTAPTQLLSVERAATGSPFDWPFALTVLWLAGFVAIVGRLALGLLAVQWMSRRTEVVTDAPWLPLARQLALDLGVSSRVRFLRSPRTTMPMAWGIVRPAVLMPADADEWPVERLRIVLLHELAHVRRRDCLTHVIAQAACAVHWFNPLAWIAARHARAERERACDDLVLTSGTRGPAYAEELLQIARVMRSGRFPAVLAGATLAMAHRSQLEGRLIAILDPAMPRTGITRVRALVASIACVCVITPLAAMQPWADGVDQARTAAAAGVPDPSALQMPNVPITSAPRRNPTPTPTPPPAPRGKTAQSVEATVRAIEDLDERSMRAAVQDLEPALSGTLDTVLASLADIQNQPSPSPAPNPQPAPSPQPVIAGAASPVRRADPRTIAALTLALKDADKEVRETAMHALVRMRDPSIFDPLVQALRDESPDVREQAAVGLGQLRDKRAVDPLIAAMKDSNGDVRQQAIVALGQLRDPRGADAMMAALKDTNADVRQQAAFGLGQLRDRRATTALTAALTDADEDVREQAVFALGQLRDPAAIDGLTIALRDARPSVRQQAVFSLGQIRDARSVDPLSAALKDANADVRQQAAFALGQIRDPRAVEALVVALKDADTDVREQSAFALGQLRDARAIDGLTTALKDPNASVRRQAAFALGQLAR